MTDDAGVRILVAGARAVAREQDRRAALEALLATLAEPLGIASGAVFVREGTGDGLVLAGATGLPEPAAAALSEAVGNPLHPVTRTLAEPAPTFNVRPTAPGGPALRSHLPLIVGQGGTHQVLGVLALAHQEPVGPPVEPILAAVSDLAAVVVARTG